MSHDLTRLAPHGDGGDLRIVVESPRGSALKLAYAPSLPQFVVSRALPLGVVYPFDWGFVPGTRGDDGDPVDAIALHDFATSPGVLLECRVLGMVELQERKRRGKPATNNRIVATPAWHEPVRPFANARDLPPHAPAEIEQFFVTVAAMTGKRVEIRGWSSRRDAGRFLRRSLV